MAAKFKQGQKVYMLKPYTIEEATIAIVQEYRENGEDKVSYVIGSAVAYEGREWYSDKDEAVTALVDLLDYDIAEAETKLAKMKTRIAELRQDVYIPNKQTQKEIKRRLDEIKA